MKMSSEYWNGVMLKTIVYTGETHRIYLPLGRCEWLMEAPQTKFITLMNHSNCSVLTLANNNLLSFRMLLRKRFNFFYR